MAIFLYILLWIITFPLAWLLMAKMAAASLGKKYRTFIFVFILYKLIIIAPYIPLLVIDTEVNLARHLAVAFILIVLVVSVAQVVGRSRVLSILWSAYSYVYDGLLYFYPYQNLMRINISMLDLEKVSGSVLNLGSGTGNLELILSNNIDFDTMKDINFIGIDNNDLMIGRARNKFHQNNKINIQFVVDDIKHFLINAGDHKQEFSRIIFSNSLYTQNDIDAIFKQCYKILLPGGILVVNDPFKTGSISIIKEHLINGNLFRLFHPKLIGVWIIDNFISSLSKTQQFYFRDSQYVCDIAQKIGFRLEKYPEINYGGANYAVSFRK